MSENDETEPSKQYHLYSFIPRCCCFYSYLITSPISTFVNDNIKAKFVFSETVKPLNMISLKSNPWKPLTKLFTITLHSPTIPNLNGTFSSSTPSTYPQHVIYIICYSQLSQRTNLVCMCDIFIRCCFLKAFTKTN